MMKCEICNSDDNIAGVMIGIDGYGQWEGLPQGQGYYSLCLWCREQIIININEFKENNTYVHSNS